MKLLIVGGKLVPGAAGMAGRAPCRLTSSLAIRRHLTQAARAPLPASFPPLRTTTRWAQTRLPPMQPASPQLNDVPRRGKDTPSAVALGPAERLRQHRRNLGCRRPALPRGSRLSIAATIAGAAAGVERKSPVFRNVRTPPADSRLVAFKHQHHQLAPHKGRSLRPRSGRTCSCAGCAQPAQQPDSATRPAIGRFVARPLELLAGLERSAATACDTASRSSESRRTDNSSIKASVVPVHHLTPGERAALVHSYSMVRHAFDPCRD